jgi:uncharacterized protein
MLNLHWPTRNPPLSTIFSEFFLLMKVNEYPMRIRELEGAISAIRCYPNEPPEAHERTPFGIVSIDVHGNVYSFSPELMGYATRAYPTFSLGKLTEKTFEEMLESSTLTRMQTEIDNGVENCRRGCDYFQVCGGGSPANKIFENGSFASTETMHCRLARQEITKFVLKLIDGRCA